MSDHGAVEAHGAHYWGHADCKHTIIRVGCYFEDTTAVAVDAQLLQKLRDGRRPESKEEVVDSTPDAIISGSVVVSAVSARLSFCLILFWFFFYAGPSTAGRLRSCFWAAGFVGFPLLSRGVSCVCRGVVWAYMGQYDSSNQIARPTIGPSYGFPVKIRGGLS